MFELSAMVSDHNQAVALEGQAKESLDFIPFSV